MISSYWRRRSRSGSVRIVSDEMFAEGFDLLQGLLCFLRFPVAQVNEGGDRRGIGKSQHGGIILFQQAPVHHAGEDAREHLRQTGQCG